MIATGEAGTKSGSRPGVSAENSATRRARRYAERFPDVTLEVLAGHLAVVNTGSVMARAVTRHLEPHDINPARYSLLRAIYFAQDRMLPQSQIAQEMGTSQPNVTQLLHALEKDGLVERVIFPENRRITFARLTPLGIERCDVLVPDMVHFMESSMEGLTTDELDDLCRLLGKVRDTLETILDS